MADSKARRSPPRQLASQLLEGALSKLQSPEQGQATGTSVTSTEPALAGVLRPGASPLARLHSKAKPTLRSEGPAIARIFSRRAIATPPRAGRKPEDMGRAGSRSGADERQRSGSGARSKSPTSTEPVAAPVATLDATAVPAAAAAPPAAAVSAATQPPASRASFDVWSLPAPTAAVTHATLAPAAATQSAAALSVAALSVAALSAVAAASPTTQPASTQPASAVACDVAVAAVPAATQPGLSASRLAERTARAATAGQRSTMPSCGPGRWEVEAGPHPQARGLL